MTPLRIYLAAPLFTPREREFNLSLAQQLETTSSVFLPQRDGMLLSERIKSGILPDVAEREIYERDIVAMQDADLIVAVLDGAHIDEGVAFELGYMKALGKLLIGFQSDTRRQLSTGNNPMLAQSFDSIFSDMEQLIRHIQAGQAKD